MSTIVGGHQVDLWMLKKRRIRRRWEDGEKIGIVAQTRVPGVSVSQVARRYDVKANLVFKWLKHQRNRGIRPKALRTRTRGLENGYVDCRHSVMAADGSLLDSWGAPCAAYRTGQWSLGPSARLSC